MKESVTLKLPILPLSDAVVFPGQTAIVDISGKNAMAAIHAAMGDAEQMLFFGVQQDTAKEAASVSDIFPVGTVAKVTQVLIAYEDKLRLQVQGLYRGHVDEVLNRRTLTGIVSSVDSVPGADDLKTRAMCRETLRRFKLYLDLCDRVEPSLMKRLADLKDAGALADAVAQEVNFHYEAKAAFLNELDGTARLMDVSSELDMEVQLVQMEADFREKTAIRMDQGQRAYYIREKMQVMRNELGEEDDEDEFYEYDRKIRGLKLAEENEDKLLKELARLKRQPFGSQEAAVLRNYLDTVLELPWNSASRDRVDVEAARKILEKDHFGLQKVKSRILEALAVKSLTPEMPTQIICLVGPPGVGKTSVAYSVARSMNRKLARVALGGVHDESDIRGHRKTYVGAMPGRIIAAIRQAGVNNPVLLLDEVDKMGSDYRGDPSAALLEVLDGEQNKNFRDHYLELPFDLSNVVFIATANTLDTVPRPLLDRMEVIEIGSYTDEEKWMIAKDHLIAKQMKKHGITKSQLRITEDAVREIISGYTRESGVRSLERSIAEICRKAAMEIVSGEEKKQTVNAKNLEKYLGVRKIRPDKMPDKDEIGLVTGLAWTSVGGETLEVEVNVMDGAGKLELTGNLGDVMKESAHAAMSYIRSHSGELGIPGDYYKTKDIHVHFPEGAVPKDGPSAGVTICTAMVSALTGTPVRRDVAMTGEISIRGRVMAIGGLREKTMAAMRHGVTTVIIPKENERDLEEIDQTVRSHLEFVTAETVDTVLKTAMLPFAKRNSETLCTL